MLWTRMAINELAKNRAFALFFILNLSVGLVGFISLNSFNSSFQAYLRDNLKSILTADMVISSPRQLSESESRAVESVLCSDRLVSRADVRESRQISFFSMISANDLSRLANIIAVDESFPLYGSIVSVTENPEKPALYQKNNAYQEQTLSSASLNQGNPEAWLGRDIAIAMNLGVGSEIRIGNRDFVVSNIVTPPPEASVSSIELAPKIYIGLAEVQNTGLLKFGSRISFKRFYRFPSGTDVKSRTVMIRERINSLFKGSPIISVYDSDNVNQNLNRIFSYFTGYMGLIGVVALFLAGIGAAYLFRGYLDTKLREIAILMSLGARRIDAYMLFTFQVSILGTIATLFSVSLSFLVLPLFPKVLQGFIPPDFKASTDLYSILAAFIPGITGSIIFCLPVFTKIHNLKPVILLQGFQPYGLYLVENSVSVQPVTVAIHRLRKYMTILVKNIKLMSGFMPAIIVFWLLAVNQTRSIERGSIFLTGSLLVMFVMTVTGTVILRFLKKLSLTDRFVLKIAFRNLYRNHVSSISCFVTIAMGAFLINVIPQIKNGIQDEISQPEGMKIPGFFLVDIQPEQLAPLTIFLESRHYALTNVSPIIRGRILNVNEKGFYERLDEKLDESKRDDSSLRGLYRRREFNFSYRESLDKSERVVKGKPLSRIPWSVESDISLAGSGKQPENIPDEREPERAKTGTRLMEISLEEGFAERFHIAIGDVMTFDIQGMALEGRVVNLRKVRWNSFQPNFFILFQKGAIDDAPKTFLASIPQMKQSEKQKLQNALVSEFPNISVLDVNQTVTQILGITDRLSFAINFMAYLAILAGLVVLFSIARYETRERLWEINLLKVLGAGFNDIRKIISLEFGFIGFVATFIGTVLSLLVSYGIAWFFFERLWSFRWEYSISCLVAITFICIATAVAATGEATRQKPAGLLSE